MNHADIIDRASGFWRESCAPGPVDRRMEAADRAAEGEDNAFAAICARIRVEWIAQNMAEGGEEDFAPSDSEVERMAEDEFKRTKDSHG